MTKQGRGDWVEKLAGEGQVRVAAPPPWKPGTPKAIHWRTPTPELDAVLSRMQEQRLRDLVADLARTSTREHAVERAAYNGSLGVLADDIQSAYWQAGFDCTTDQAMAFAAAKIAGRVKLPPVLKPDHVQRCPRCSRAHILPLTDAEMREDGAWGFQDAVDRLCILARAVANQDDAALRELPVGSEPDITRMADAIEGRAATTGGGRRIAWGTPDETGSSGNLGTGVGPPPPGRRRRRIATGSRRDNAILQEIADELRDRVVRQADETALTARRRAWMTKDHGKATKAQIEAYRLVQVVGWSQRTAAEKLRVSRAKIQRLIAGYIKEAGELKVEGDPPAP